MEQSKNVSIQEIIDQSRLNELSKMAKCSTIKRFCKESLAMRDPWRTYVPASSCGHFGRVFATHQPSTARMSRNARAFLTQGDFIDFDIVNAHPTILHQTLTKIGITPPKTLNDYMTNREEWLSMDTSIPRKIAKEFFISIMYGGKSENFMKLHKIKSVPKKWLHFETEFAKIEHAITHHYAGKLHGIPEKAGTKKSSRILSIINQSIENSILMSMIKSIARNCGIDVFETESVIAIEMNALLMYDGFMIDIDHIDEDADIDELCEAMEEDVFAETGYNVQITEKPIEYSADEGFSDYKMDTPRDVSKKSSPILPTEEFSKTKLSNLPTYEEKVSYFEQFHFNVSHLWYIRTTLDSDYSVLKQSDFKSRYQNVFTQHPTKDKTIPFLDRYLPDENRASFNEVIFEPKTAKKEALNLFTGFPEFPEAHDDQMLADFMALTMALCDNNADYAGLLLDFIAHILRFPERKGEAGISFILYGKQGIGKSLFINLIRPLFGKMFAQVSDLNDVFGKFANAHKNKLLLNLNEADDRTKSMYSLDGMIKTFITETETTIEYKGKDRHPISNHTRLLITTNKMACIPISRDDRRFIALKGRDVLQGNDDFRNRLISYVSNGDFCSVLNTMLRNRKIDAGQFDARKWRTKLWQTMATVQGTNIDTIISDINESLDLTEGVALINDDQEVPIITHKDLFLIKLKDLHIAGKMAYGDLGSSRKFNAKIEETGQFEIFVDGKNKTKHIIVGRK